ncbi:MAG TPA: aminomethyltransferase family protein [Pyrinomonadaceae bacterium]
MSETAERIESKELALKEVHSLYGASFREEDGWRVPANYGDAGSEYRAVRNDGGGLIDLSPRGRIHVTGSEALMFLNGLVTNDMKTLGEDRWMLAVFPNVQGRILAAVRIVRTADGFLIDTEPATHERVLKTIERFTLAGDFKVADITASTVMLTVQGSAAADVVATFVGAEVTLDRNGARQLEWRDQALTLLRATHTAEDGFDLIAPRENATALWDMLVEAEAHPTGYDAFERLRIEAGIPRFGRDMDETTVVTETNLDDAVSYTKGCYVGQEIIVRIKHRGHVAKKLAGLVLEKETAIEPGAAVKSEAGADIGRITSATFSPTLDRTVAIAYLKYEFLSAGTMVKVNSSEGELSATVSELPLVRGSWYRD